jgi:hypothetical protein
MCSRASIARLCDGCTTAFQVWPAAGLNEGVCVFAHKDIAAGLHPPALFGNLRLCRETNRPGAIRE